ncbi:hypothetical protein QE374_002493 [Microbacterium sp. SORGH_AS428]|uniref:hypothetical protein n=1 Tax=Microbacterium sp. SORGH_AS_0428 TaxID=3041788 RepID=UPI00285C1C57|nr:hypothetical protein [Microbacterium sp. SORGH_AS_0428]MDR6200584.1 hypothetical protein [Microbacterium sp. SORGH_AS_0428]
MRKTGAFIAVLLAATLTGCAGALPFVSGEPRGDAVPIEELRCGDGFGGVDPDVVAGAVPDGFESVALHRCEGFTTQADAEGVWAGSRVERFEGDLSELLAALAEPNAAAAFACPASMWIGPELWLEGADGRFIRVPYPSDGCAQPRLDVLDRIEAAVSRLSLVEERFQRGGLIESAEATAAGCTSTAGLLVRTDVLAGVDIDQATVVPEVGATAVPVPPPPLPGADEVTGMRVCRYAPAPLPAEGSVLSIRGVLPFSGVDDLDREGAARVLALFGEAGPAGACEAEATSTVVLHPLPETQAGATVTVELDGCRRVVGPDLRAVVAPEEMLALLAP